MKILLNVRSTNYKTARPFKRAPHGDPAPLFITLPFRSAKQLQFIIQLFIFSFGRSLSMDRQQLQQSSNEHKATGRVAADGQPPQVMATPDRNNVKGA